MITMLTKGWFGRTVILLLWIAGMAISLNNKGQDNGLAEASLLLFNCSFYFMVAMRLPQITLMQQRYVIPHYFSKLKQSLLVLLLISFIPTLVLLPDVVNWLNILSISTLLAMLIVTIVYKPKYSVLFFVLMLLPPNIFSTVDVHLFTLPFSLSELFSYSLPLVLFSAFKLIDKLENYRGDVKQIALFMSMSSFSVEKVLADQDNLPDESRNKLSQWLLKLNGQYFLTLIRSDKKLSNRKLIAIACQSISSLGRGTYFFWLFAIVLICSLGLYLGEGYYRYFTPAMVILPAIMVGSGTLTFFHIVYGRKAYLARLSLMPIFENNHSFITAFVSFVVIEQIKLYVFISLMLATFALVFKFLDTSTLLNVIAGVFTLGVFNLALMLWGWCRKKHQDSLVTWIMFSAFMFFMVFLFIVADNKIQFLQSNIFITLFLMTIVLFSCGLYRSYQRIPHWLS